VCNLIWIYALHHEIKDAGQAGDLFGAINSLFTGLAFSGLIGTMIFQQRELKLQRRELRLQREEVADTRGEISAQKEQIILQNENMRKQMIEQTNYQKLRVFNDYIDGINSNDANPARGRDQIAKLWKQIFPVTAGESLEQIAKTYHTVYFTQLDYIGGFYRLLYNIIKFVEVSNFSDQKQYTNIANIDRSHIDLLS
jgi:hypothetical protein